MDVCEDSSENLELEQAESKRRREQRRQAKLILLESGCSADELCNESFIHEVINQTKSKQNRRKHRSKKKLTSETNGDCGGGGEPSTTATITTTSFTNNMQYFYTTNSIIQGMPTHVDISTITEGIHNILLPEQMVIQQFAVNNINNVININDQKQNKERKTLSVDVTSENHSKSSSMQIVSNKKLANFPDKRNNLKLIKNKKNKNGKKPDNNCNRKQAQFGEYLPLDQVKIGLETGDLISGSLRINIKDHKTSYINNPVRHEPDIIMLSVMDRNGALEGDQVVVKIKPESEWRNNQKTAIVVHILKLVHSRKTVGNLKLMDDKNKRFAFFTPRDPRVPRMKIPFVDWPANFFNTADEYEHVLFLAQIVKWTEPKMAVGTLLENIGMAGDLKVETKAILAENCLDVTPYTDDMKKYYSSSGEIPESEYTYRIDLRDECIFTIDPLTARDLDDAVSCKELPNGNYSIGVHISDVTYHLKERTPLDEIVASKATSIYMVESVYHMLPKELCMICSLLPGDDKLAFSVFWEMTPDAEIVSTSFARTVINSCVQLAYEHAQNIIDNPGVVLDDKDLPQIHNGFKPHDLCTIVRNLNKLAIILRKNRFQNGALRIDQPKLQFSLDAETCQPKTYTLYENKECHRLIEEFMLLANNSVARKLRYDYPDIAFLRRHDPPNEFMLQKLKISLEKIDVDVDVSSSDSIQKSLWNHTSDDGQGAVRMLVLNLLFAKTMTRALYFCAGNAFDDANYWHYALSIPLYTHFTSPIRRYADIMVHRQLASSLGYRDRIDWTEEYVSEIADTCNKQKYNAKRAGEQSCELYLMKYIEEHQPMTEYAVVLDLKNNSFDAIVIANGLTVRVYFNNFDENMKWYYDEDDSKDKNSDEEEMKTQLIIEWPEITNEQPFLKQTIKLFSMIKISLTKREKVFKIDAKLLRPEKV